MNRRRSNATIKEKTEGMGEAWMPYSMPALSIDPSDYPKQNKLSMRSNPPQHYKGIKKMANKVSSFSHLIQRFTTSCLVHPFQTDRLAPGQVGDEFDDDVDMEEYDDHEEEHGMWEGGKFKGEMRTERVIEMEIIMGEVFDSVMAMKTAYVCLQEAHSPWNPDKMTEADMAVVAELQRLGMLREKFWCSLGGTAGKGKCKIGAATLREVVAPYESAVDELRNKLKAKEAEVGALKEKLKTTSSINSGKKSTSSNAKSNGKVNCTTQAKVMMSPEPAPELFESTMGLVKEASKSFTASLLSLMRSASWDIAAAVRSIEAAFSPAAPTAFSPTDSIIGSNHAKYALESYVNRKMFLGFDNETFNMDGGRFSPLLHQDQHRRDSFGQYRDMSGLDPVDLLGVLPNCSFGTFCFKKFLALVHPKMEESLFGDLEQRRLVLAGKHPRTQFYGEFLALAKALWLLHLLAFSLEPPPSHFEANRGSKYHSQYMESVVKCSSGIGGRLGMGLVVGFPVSPGFKLANGSVVKSRVYVVSNNGI
ncbi:unnamed protein product [Cuscuta epithymum]|uniref:DUF641 domain-containing protein n=1 Tax=Cuscuta epithymum TaxID=186058 RepID=A0AAV0CHA5_9ASTE|nr:unnamed protein product [Cuscuta epithymum]